MIRLWEIQQSDNRDKCPVCFVTTFLDEHGACFNCTDKYNKSLNKKNLTKIAARHRNEYRNLIVGSSFEPHEAIKELEWHLLNS
jgi:hypothetical protein